MLGFVQEDEKGVRVIKVYRNSPAYRAGIHKGEYIKKFGSRTIEELRDFVRTLGTLVPGQKVTLITDKGRHVIKVGAVTPKTAFKRFQERFGMKLDDVKGLPAKFRKVLPQGGVVIVTLYTSGMAYSMGLRPLDVITSVNGKKVNNIKELQKLLSFVRSGGSIYLTVWRSGRSYPLVIPY